MERYAPNLKDPPRATWFARDDHRDQRRPWLRPDKDHVHLDITHLGRHHHEAPAGHREIGSSSPASIAIKADPGRADLPLPDGRHPDQLQGQVVVPKDGNPNSPVAGFYAAGEVRLRLGAWRQPPRHQLAARPAGVRQVGRAKPWSRTSSPASSSSSRCRPDAADVSLAA